MGFLFSAVTLTAGEYKTSFLVSGMPHRVEDIEGQYMFNCFLEDLDIGQEIKVRADAYHYGKGASTAATREELGYMKMRVDLDKDFLKDRCEKVDTARFSFKLSPEQTFQPEMTM